MFGCGQDRTDCREDRALARSISLDADVALAWHSHAQLEERLKIGEEGISEAGLSELFSLDKPERGSPKETGDSCRCDWRRVLAKASVFFMQRGTVIHDDHAWLAFTQSLHRRKVWGSSSAVNHIAGCFAEANVRIRRQDEGRDTLTNLRTLASKIRRWTYGNTGSHTNCSVHSKVMQTYPFEHVPQQSVKLAAQKIHVLQCLCRNERPFPCANTLKLEASGALE